MLAITLNPGENPLSVVCTDCGVNDLPRSPAELCQHSKALNKTTAKRGEGKKKKKACETSQLIREYLTVKSIPSIELHGWLGLIRQL